MPVASAAASRPVLHGTHGGLKMVSYSMRHGGRGRFRLAKAGGGGGISCVPFARNESGIGLSGNAATWWDEAAGVYARGSAPELGSILNFRANYAMHLGHVAVVSTVINNRQIEIDHANWAGPGAGRGHVSRDISVIDVSQNNDWTAVRVALGHSGEYGSVYPTYGFIYDRPDGSQPRVAVAAQSDLNPPPRDLRPVGERTPLAVVHPVRVPHQAYDEVAEAPPERGAASTTLSGFTLDAPDRNLR
ncbi:MAG: CHAP domain-containing protein [Acidisphaera sp.]|nr:CHAP domain-containing protein [Acidisphaera sp.]